MFTFNQRTGELLEDGLHVAFGYSGFGEFKNDPGSECLQNEGPIPKGRYTFLTPVTHPVLGPVAFKLFPDASNEMFGRRDFWIHGDNPTHTASHGCIILDRPTREHLAASRDHTLTVTED